MEDELFHLFNLGAICLVGQGEQVHISPIEVVLKKNGGNRLIIDMHLINTNISPQKFKYKPCPSSQEGRLYVNNRLEGQVLSHSHPSSPLPLDGILVEGPDVL